MQFVLLLERNSAELFVMESPCLPCTVDGDCSEGKRHTQVRRCACCLYMKGSRQALFDLHIYGLDCVAVRLPAPVLTSLSLSCHSVAGSGSGFLQRTFLLLLCPAPPACCELDQLLKASISTLQLTAKAVVSALQLMLLNCCHSLQLDLQLWGGPDSPQTGPQPPKPQPTGAMSQHPVSNHAHHSASSFLRYA